ncbi:MAG: phage shock protein PspA [Azospirillaceae bacterium]
MGIFSRMGDIVNANLNALLDRAEDPEKIVRLIVQEMEDTLVEVRASAAKSLAEKKEINRKIEHLEAARADWRAKAELAVSKGRDELARGALVAKARAEEAAEEMRRELAAVDEALAKTNDDLAKLQAKLAEAKNKQKAIDIRRQSATDRLKVRRNLHDGRIDDALSRYEMIERKLDDLEGRVESYDLGAPGGGDQGGRPARSLDQEFADLESETRVEDELAALKAKLSGGSGKSGAAGGER